MNFIEKLKREYVLNDFNPTFTEGDMYFDSVDKITDFSAELLKELTEYEKQYGSFGTDILKGIILNMGVSIK